MTPFTTTVECHYINERFVGPGFVRFSVTQDDLNRWQRVAKFVADNDLFSASDWDDRCVFLERLDEAQFVEAHFRQECSRFVITSNCVHFTGLQANQPSSSEWATSYVRLEAIARHFAKEPIHVRQDH